MVLSESQIERRKREAAEARRRLSEEEKRKAEDKERKKAEVRARLEEAARAKKGKKGFMTPERKKKLRTLLRAKAAEELKREQERKAKERRELIGKRIGTKPDLDGNADKLSSICRELHTRLAKLEDNKYDLEFDVRQKDFVINELTIQVNDLRGKFVKPSLKKVAKYGANLEKMAKIAAKAEMDFRNNLKRVQSTKFTMEEEKEGGKPEWALGKGKGVEGGEEIEADEE